MEDKPNWLSGFKLFFARIAPYRVTFFLSLLLIIIFVFIIIVPLFISPIPVPEAFATDPNWLIPTVTPTPLYSPTPTPTQSIQLSDSLLDLITATPRVEIFSDDFESGDLQSWTMVQTGPGGFAVVQAGTVWDGEYSAHLTVADNVNSNAYIRITFQQPQPELWVSGYFMIQQEGPEGSNVPFFRFYSSSGERLITFYRQNFSNDQIWIGVEDDHYETYGVLPIATWANVVLHIVAAGEGASTIEAFLDNSPIYITNSASLDETGILEVQIGNETLKQVFDVYVDDISIWR